MASDGARLPLSWLENGGQNEWSAAGAVIKGAAATKVWAALGDCLSCCQVMSFAVVRLANCWYSRCNRSKGRSLMVQRMIWCLTSGSGKQEPPVKQTLADGYSLVP